MAWVTGRRKAGQVSEGLEVPGGCRGPRTLSGAKLARPSGTAESFRDSDVKNSSVGRPPVYALPPTLGSRRCLKGPATATAASFDAAGAEVDSNAQIQGQTACSGQHPATVDQHFRISARHRTHPSPTIRTRQGRGSRVMGDGVPCCHSVCPTGLPMNRGSGSSGLNRAWLPTLRADALLVAGQIIGAVHAQVSNGD